MAIKITINIANDGNAEIREKSIGEKAEWQKTKNKELNKILTTYSAALVSKCNHEVKDKETAQSLLDKCYLFSRNVLKEIYKKESQNNE